MIEQNRDFTFEEYCKLINDFAPCMDGYPYFYDIKKDVYYISERALERFALPSNQFTEVTEMHKKFVYEEDIDMLLEDLHCMISGKKDEHDIEYRWMGKEGKPLWINCRGRVIKDENGRPKCMLGCVNEIAARRKADNVSGLKSLHSVAGTLETFCRVAAGGYTLHIGIDHFKVINETFGHEYGNFIIHGVAECIAECIGPAQEVYHVIADEFLVVDYLSDSAEEGRELYNLICAKIDKFIEKNRYETVFTVSGGILFCKELGGMAFDEFIKLSEFALNRAKKLGRNQVYFFEINDYEMFLRKNSILSTLKESISADYEGFEVYFQPSMQESSEEAENTVETLLRYTMPNGEVLTIEEIISVLEENGLIIPVGKWMIDQAVSYCKNEQQYTPGLKVNVTIPYVRVIKSPFVMVFLRALKEYGVEMPIEDMEQNLTENIRKTAQGLGVKICIEGMGVDEPVKVKVIIK